jgi:hypothetical protein
MCEGMVVGNTLANGVAAGLVINYEALRLIGDSTYEMVQVSYRNNKTWRETASVLPIISLGIDPTVDNQRRRLPGRGR